MLIYDFADRAEECLKLSQQTHSPRDRDLFIEMARAWYGMKEAEAEIAAPKRPH
jgi:hypothetical protein